MEARHGEVPVSHYLLLTILLTTVTYHGEVPVCHGRRAVDPHVAYAKAAQVHLQV